MAAALAGACADTSGPAGDRDAPTVLSAQWRADTLLIATGARAAELRLDLLDSSGISAATAFLTFGTAGVRSDCANADSRWHCLVPVGPEHAGFRLVLDSARVTDGAGNSAMRRLSATLQVLPHPRLAECRAQVIDLAPGAVHFFPGAAGCVTLARGGEYEAAVFDAQIVDAVREARFTTGMSVVAAIASPFHVPQDADPSSSQSSATSTSPAYHAGGDEICDTEPELIICRETAFAPGEDIRIVMHQPRLELNARIVAKRGFLTYAVQTNALDQWTSEWSAALDTVSQQHLDVIIPLLRATLHPDRVTTTRAGELLILLTRDPGPSHARLWFGPGWSRGLPVIRLFRPAPTFDVLFDIVAHELAHVWQARHRAETIHMTWPFWAAEGGAVLLATEAVRRLGGFAHDGNYTADELFATTQGAAYASILGGRGRLQSGYYDAAGYLRGLWHQCMHAGGGEHVCRTEIMRGSMEDWYAPFGAGLTTRMQRLLGPSWDPVRSVLQWALATAVDDRTDDVALQIPAVRNAWSESLFVPTGSRAVADTLGVTAELQPGSAAYFRVYAAAGELLDLLPRQPNARWALLRLN